MKTPLQAMLWELWRKSRYEILLRVTGISLFVLMLIGIQSSANKPTPPELEVMTGAFLILLMCISVSSQAWIMEFDRQNIGFSFRLGFSRPVSTAMLVLVPLTYTVFSGILCYLIPAFIFSAQMNVTVPVVGPIVFVACTIVFLLGSTWSPTTIFARVVAVCGLLLAVVSSFVLHYANGYSDVPFITVLARPQFYDVGVLPTAALLIATAACTVLTIFCVDRQRHGEGSVVAQIAMDWCRKISKDVSNGRRQSQAVGTNSSFNPFRSRYLAQCWYEFRRFGRTVLFLSVVAPICIVALIVVISLVNPGWEGACEVWFGVLLVCPFVYQMIGVDAAVSLKHTQGTMQLSAFDATRAMTNVRLVEIKLLVVGGMTLAGWLIMGVAVAIYTSLTGDWAFWTRLGENASQLLGEISVVWWVSIAATLGLLYVVCSSGLLGAWLWMPSHPMLFASVCIVLYFEMFLCFWDSQHGWILAPLWKTMGYIIPIANIATSVWVLKKAWRAGFIRDRLFIAVFFFWLIVVASIASLYSKVAHAIPEAVPPLAQFALASTLLIPLATAINAPLALGSQRHR